MPTRSGAALWRDGRGRAGLVILLLVTGLALLAPVVSPVGPDTQRNVVQTRFLPPGATDLNRVFHPLGTDRLGRDVFSRVVYTGNVWLVELTQ